jgi:hypothetical protein
MFSFALQAQQYGNEWINYAQDYYSFKITNTGIYHIDANALNASGIPVSSINANQFQIFARQREIPLYVNDGGDGVLNGTDYIEFYAQKNDGWLDSVLYKNPYKMGNPGYSLYNDTIQYFLTWNTVGTGKRFSVETDVNYPSYIPSNFVLSKTIFAPNTAYLDGYKEAGSSSSFFVDGEGYGITALNGAGGGASYTQSFSTSNFYVGADAPDLHLLVNVMSNASADNVSVNHHLRLTFAGNQILDQTFTGYQQIQVNNYYPNSWITGASTNLKMDIIDDLGAATDFQSMTYAELNYPHALAFSGESYVELYVPFNASQSKTRLDLTGISGTNLIAYVVGNAPKKIPVVSGATNYLLIPNDPGGSTQKVILTSTFFSVPIAQLSPVNGTAKFTDFSALNYENALIMVYNKLLLSASQDYKTYRESPAGGSYNVVFANIDELYQQFGGGIDKHILSIRRFAHFAYNKSTLKPLGLFLMGKGVSTIGHRTDQSSYTLCLIPSFGYPSSDVCILNNMEGNQLAPIIPIGRIAVKTNQELTDYLNKVKENVLQQDPYSVYNTPNKDWQKQILHFGGGTGASQQSQLKGYLEQMAQIATHEYFGGNVQAFYKTTSSPFDPATLESIRQRLQNGVSLVTFFDHATSDGFEINIDEPENWNNSGKYPLILGNACYTGDIFHGGTILSTSEKFVEVPNEGAIAFLSASTLGFAPYLFYFSREFYRQFSLLNYGETLGQQIKNTIDVVENMTLNQIMETTCTQMILNGDPMVRLNPHNRPEIELLETNVSFLPTNIDLSTQYISVQVIVTNLGKSITDSVYVSLTRDFPGLVADSVYQKILPRLDYKDTLLFTLPLQPNVSLGANIFTITVDLPSVIPEQYDEFTNNKVVKTLYISIDGILPVLPYDFAVVPNDSVTVKASTVNPFASINTYRFEIDTTDLFNSPEHRFSLKNEIGGVKTVKPTEWFSAVSGYPKPLVCTDSTVYFWRVALLNSSTPLWHEQSFQYIVGKEGWGQDHFFQFKKNEFISVNYNRIERKREFSPLLKHVSCDVYDHANSYDEYGATWWFIDQNLQEYALCGLSPDLYVAVVDPATFIPWGTRHFNTTTSTWENPSHNFGNANDNGACRDRVERFFTFHQNVPSSLAAFESMINAIPDSFYVLIYTPVTAAYSYWQPSTYNLFTNVLHSDSIYAGRPDQAFIFFGKKGTNTLNKEMVAQYNHQYLHLVAPMPGSIYSGVENSTVIGPSAQWKNVYWKQDPSEPTPGDSTILRITAMDANYSSVFSIDTTFTRNDSLLNLEALIDHTNYPFIRLSALYKDTATFTPAQIDRWHVLYGQLPEAAIDASNGYYWTFTQDSVQEGQTGEFAVDIKNIGKVDMDSLLVNYWILDANQIKHPVPYARQDSLRVGQTFRDTVSFSTAGLNGLNSFWIEVNPYVNGSNVITDQPEQFHFNNIAQIKFNIKNDNKNPILDVTFDGVHILDKDIVSPKSQIVVSLKDDNPFLLMNQIADTSLFGIYLKDPNGVQTRIPFVNSSGQQILQWIPASNSYNKFKIIYNANFEKDGIYTLSVQGSDKSGNLSGDFDYQISFEIIHESSITYLMNYPNPFSTSTRFVFTLTGETVPDHMIIQIMTMTGKVVREITQAELGPIRIGKNVSQYALDGRDEFGDLLANGVYLYRVLTDLNNDAIKHRDSGADKYFKKEFGKMYLMR